MRIRSLQWSPLSASGPQNAYIYAQKRARLTDGKAPKRSPRNAQGPPQQAMRIPQRAIEILDFLPTKTRLSHDTRTGYQRFNFKRSPRNARVPPVKP